MNRLAESSNSSMHEEQEKTEQIKPEAAFLYMKTIISNETNIPDITQYQQRFVDILLNYLETPQPKNQLANQAVQSQKNRIKYYLSEYHRIRLQKINKNILIDESKLSHFELAYLQEYKLLFSDMFEKKVFKQVEQATKSSFVEYARKQYAQDQQNKLIQSDKICVVRLDEDCDISGIRCYAGETRMFKWSQIRESKAYQEDSITILK
ncbi:GINS [Hexamita inflata]|uniref:GINS n=1 Tax=Hexamita inflata TaxID=28002 RepID=A0AA86NNJ2_9EUKA|nr:GINS [Hexamita inflata]CAI9948897.1 GINS [Hexamita inflata]